MEKLPFHQNSFYKKSRKGNLLKLIRERYLRDDISCGYLLGNSITEIKLLQLVHDAPHKHLLILDTNVLIHQIDVLEYNCPATSLVVILQTVLQEVRHINLSIYRRVMSLIQNDSKSYIFYPNEMMIKSSIIRKESEIINDYNDRLIRESAKYFNDILSQNENEECKAILITNDLANSNRAREDKITSYTLKSYLHNFLHQYPELFDLLADDVSKGDMATANRESLFPHHLPLDEITKGIKNKQYYRGVLRCRGGGRLGYDDCYIVIHQETGSGGKTKANRWSVSIKGRDRINRALDGDIVAVELIQPGEISKYSSIALHPSESLQASVSIAEDTAVPTAADIEGLKHSGDKEGRVVGIIRRNWRQYAGSVVLDESKDSSPIVVEGESDDAAGSTPALFLPVDPKLPPVKISSRRIEELLGKRVLVAVDHWPVWSSLPFGHYVRILGVDGVKEIETQVLLHEYGVPCDDFTTEVMACLPPGDWKITNEIVSQRTDLRHLPIVSIDPPGCKDIDDALHCRPLENGNFEVGVHIADVSYFVKPETPLDLEAAHRSTSTYLVERRLDMLPSLLTTELCSLRSSEDHLAFTVLWEMDSAANIIDAKFCRSVIRSVASLTYDQAQAMLDIPDTQSLDDSLESKIINSVKALNVLARQLKQQRINEGALTLASPEVRFKFEDENSSNPTDVTEYAIKESHQLVEEFMLLANITVSKKVLRHYPTLAILRRHQPPSQEQFIPLVSAANAVGVHLDISTSKALAVSLDRAVRPEDSFFNKLLLILSTRCMMPAQYFCSGEIPKDQWHHYGLAAPVYTHFTSPIRRYADLVVHRLLSAAIGDTSLPTINADRTKQQELCSHMNRRHRSAQHVQRASTGLHTILYFRGRPSIETAYILSVFSDKIVVIAPKFGLEGTLLVPEVVKTIYQLEGSSLPPDGEIPQLVDYDADSHLLKIQVNQKNNSSKLIKLQVFQKIQVLIRVEEGNDRHSIRKLLMTLVPEGSTDQIKQSITPSPQKMKKDVTASVDEDEVETELHSELSIQKKRKPSAVESTSSITDQPESVPSKKSTKKRKKLRTG